MVAALNFKTIYTVSELTPEQKKKCMKYAIIPLISELIGNNGERNEQCFNLHHLGGKVDQLPIEKCLAGLTIICYMLPETV